MNNGFSAQVPSPQGLRPCGASSALQGELPPTHTHTMQGILSNLPEPQFLHLYNGADDSAYFLALLSAYQVPKHGSCLPVLYHELSWTTGPSKTWLCLTQCLEVSGT